MRILGIDPGLEHIGYGVIDNPSTGVYLCASWHKEPSGRGSKISLVEVPGYHLWTKSTTPMPARLQSIFDETRRIVEKYKPDAVSIEQFIGIPRQMKQSASIGAAYGAIICGCGDLVPYTYTPSEVKLKVAMNGAAKKDEVELAVRSIMGFEDAVTVSHVSDAFAIAVTHGMRHAVLPSARRRASA